MTRTSNILAKDKDRADYIFSAAVRLGYETLGQSASARRVHDWINENYPKHRADWSPRRAGVMNNARKVLGRIKSGSDYTALSDLISMCDGNIEKTRDLVKAVADCGGSDSITATLDRLKPAADLLEGDIYKVIVMMELAGEG